MTPTSLAGWPARADYPTEAALYAARSAWLNDPAHGYTKGIAIPHPDYDDFAAFPVNFDVGVVELNAPVSLPTYGVLAPLGTAETLVASAKNKNGALVETVGYGIQSIQPQPLEVDTRYKSTSRIVELNGNASKGGNLHTLNNPSAIGGRGGSCFGDSGGPVFVEQHEPGGRRGLVGQQRNLPRRRLLVASGQPGQLRVHRFVSSGADRRLDRETPDPDRVRRFVWLACAR